MEIGDLQPRAVDDLEVHHQFPAVIINDHDADGASASLERLSQTTPETRLVKDLNALLNVTLRKFSISAETKLELSLRSLS